MRYFFEISYKGTKYHGWQIQNNATSVQQVIQERIKQLLGEAVEIIGSGRTDAGVHAKQQYFHADIKNELETVDFQYHLNAVLPNDIVVRSIYKVIPEAHARFDALSRSYEYIITSQKDPFRENEVYIYHKPIDLEKLNTASKYLLGRHNFESFSKVKTQVNNFNCEVFFARWSQQEEQVLFQIKANRFLRGMVRAIVGTLLLVNEDKIGDNTIEEILLSKNRKNAGRSVPAEGLYLSQIIYPEHIFIN